MTRALHEQVAVAGVLDRLEEQFPEFDPAVVEAAVRLANTQLTDTSLNDVVPVQVEHAARDRLASLEREGTIDEALPPPSS